MVLTLSRNAVFSKIDGQKRSIGNIAKLDLFVFTRRYG